MEEVAIMIPPPLVNNEHNNDELSDETESINLDLHVSDTEDSTESSKKGDVANHEQTESEEDILNKYIDDGYNESAKKSKCLDEEKSKLVNGVLEKQSEIYKKCDGTISPPSLKEIEEGEDDLMDTLADEKDNESLNDDTLKKNDENDDTIVEEQSSEDKDEVSIPQNENSKKQTIENVDEVLSDTPKEQSQDTKSTEIASDRTDSDKKKISDDKMDIDESKEKESAKSCEKTEKPCSIQTKSDNSSSSTEEASSSSSKKSSETKTESDNNEDDDLLCVMDEKSLEEANENKDENSCSASERDDEAKESEENNDEENNEESNEDTNYESNDGAKEDEETEEMIESQAEVDVESGECAMDIEESDIGGVVYTEESSRVAENEQLRSDDSNKIDGDKDANKENEHGHVAAVTEKAVKENGVADYTEMNGITEKPCEDDVVFEGFDESEKDTSKKSTKRPLSDTSTESESTKKIRLETEDVESEPEKEKRPIKLLDKFKKFMLDKKLKTLSRFELEELCIQKMCECIVNKSEIGELRQKITIQEQTIDTWRKEAVVVAKQTRDLKIVHERLMADLKAMREQTGKPLVPVKITRSVGLQAILENPPRIRPGPIVGGPGPAIQQQQHQRSPAVTQQPNKTVPSPQTRKQVVQPKTQPQRVNSVNNRPLQPISQKDNVNTAKSRQSLPSPQAKKNADPKAVIDLTDEDEKNQTAKQTTNTASPTVRILNKQNVNGTPKTTATTPSSQASKIMFVSPGVLPRNSAVMVKMNSNGLVTSANGITTIPNGQVSVVTSPVVRTVSQVRVPISSVSTVRTASPAKQPIYKHPAPLPAAPNYQVSTFAGKKPIPPKPHLNLTRSNCGTGIVLQWKMPYKLDSYETIVSYQLYAYQETKSPPKTDNWGKIGDVKALELPMAVTLTQFAVGNRYFFAVRAVDGQKRLGPFSDPENILL